MATVPDPHQISINVMTAATLPYLPDRSAVTECDIVLMND